MSRSKPSRNGATTRNHRGEQTAEKEDPDRQQQADPGNKRKGRSDRRRADGTTTSSPNSTILVSISNAHADTDSDPSEEMPLAARSAVTRTAAAAAAAAAATSSNSSHPAPADSPRLPTEPPPQQLSAPDTPPANPAPSRADRKRSHKKKGRNQYTRDRDGNDEDSPARSVSRDIQKDDNGGGNSGGGGGSKSAGADGGKSGTKNKGGMSSKVTMTDLKRRASALLDFISRTQVELAGETTPPGGEDAEEKPNGESSSPNGKQPDAEPERSAPAVVNGDATQGKNFKDLGCMEMMDSLTRRLVKWQQEYGA